MVVTLHAELLEDELLPALQNVWSGSTRLETCLPVVPNSKGRNHRVPLEVTVTCDGRKSSVLLIAARNVAESHQGLPVYSVCVRMD